MQASWVTFSVFSDVDDGEFLTSVKEILSD